MTFVTALCLGVAVDNLDRWRVILMLMCECSLDGLMSSHFVARIPSLKRGGKMSSYSS